MIIKKLLSSKRCIFISLSLILSFGCASLGIKPETEPADDIEARIESMGAKLVSALKSRDFAAADMAIIQESSISTGEVSQFGTFATDRLRQILTGMNFSMVEMNGAPGGDGSGGEIAGIPGDECGMKGAPLVILLLNVKDYGPSSEMIYVSVTGKHADSNSYIEGLVVEEQFNRSDRIVAWLGDKKPVPPLPGTQDNPFKDIDRGAEFLARGIYCPYQKLVKKWERGEQDETNINPEEITLVIVGVNSSSGRAGKFEQIIMQKIKGCLIRKYGVENAVDFADYKLADEVLTFHEKEGTFSLDYTAVNQDRFKPGTVLLIVDTFFHTNSRVDVAVRASWIKGQAETVAGDVKRVGGTYLPGFATNAYFYRVSSGEGIKDEAEPVKVAGGSSGEPLPADGSTGNPISVRLDGAAEHEVAEVFRRILNAAEGIIDTGGHRSVDRHGSAIVWEVTADDTAASGIQKNIMKVINSITGTGGKATTKGNQIRCTRAEAVMLKQIRPGSCSRREISFVIDRGFD